MKFKPESLDPFLNVTIEGVPEMVDRIKEAVRESMNVYNKEKEFMETYTEI